MTTTAVLRIKLVGGANMDITIEGSGVGEDELVDHAISALATSSGMLRARHGDRLVVVFARGVAAVEVAPRGAVL